MPTKEEISEWPARKQFTYGCLVVIGVLAAVCTGLWRHNNLRDELKEKEKDQLQAEYRQDLKRCDSVHAEDRRRWEAEKSQLLSDALADARDRADIEQMEKALSYMKRTKRNSLKTLNEVKTYTNPK